MQPHFAHICEGIGMISCFQLDVDVASMFAKRHTLSKTKTQVIPSFPLLTPLLAKCTGAPCNLTLLIFVWGAG